MRPFNVGQYVKTPDKIGRILYMADYQHGQNGETEATSAVVLSGTFATKYPFSVLSPSTLEAYEAAQKAQNALQSRFLEPDDAGKIAQI